jgi:hypothetical protein
VDFVGQPGSFLEKDVPCYRDCKLTTVAQIGSGLALPECGMQFAEPLGRQSAARMFCLELFLIVIDGEDGSKFQ